MYKIKRFSALAKISNEIKNNPIGSAALMVSTANAANNIIKARKEDKIIKEKKTLLDSLKSSTKKKKPDKNLNVIYL